MALARHMKWKQRNRAKFGHSAACQWAKIRQNFTKSNFFLTSQKSTWNRKFNKLNHPTYMATLQDLSKANVCLAIWCHLTELYVFCHTVENLQKLIFLLWLLFSLPKHMGCQFGHLQHIALMLSIDFHRGAEQLITPKIDIVMVVDAQPTYADCFTMNSTDWH